MDVLEEVLRLRREGKRAVMATIVHTNGSIPSFESSRMLVREDGSIVGTIGGGCVEAEVWAAAKDVLKAEAPRKMTFNLNNEASFDNGLICGGTLEVFVEPVLPQPTLYIFGGGHVSMALANAAHTVGFSIGVIDDREQFANSQRFPMAAEIYTSFEDSYAKIKPNPSDSYLLIVTRGHRDDMRVLAWARQDQRALHRHDRQQAQSAFGLSGARTRGLRARAFRSRERPSRPQYWRAHASKRSPSALRRRSSPCAVGPRTLRTRPSSGRTTKKKPESKTSTPPRCGRRRRLKTKVLRNRERFSLTLRTCSPPSFFPGVSLRAWVRPRRSFHFAARPSSRTC